MANLKTLEQLRTEKQRAEVQFAQARHSCNTLHRRSTEKHLYQIGTDAKLFYGHSPKSI